MVVERDRPERRERRVGEAEPVVADDDEARARKRLAGGGVDDPRQGELALERLAVGPEPDGDAERRELAGGDLVRAAPAGSSR